MVKTRALEGIKVVDFSWAIAGPGVGRFLANYGATVIRLESSLVPDALRVSPPYKDGKPGLDRTAYFATHNAGKYGVSLNMDKAKAREVLKKLAKWADVFLESFRPGVLERWGLDYEEIKKIKPDIIMASTTQLGQHGPFSGFRGYGAQGAALAGVGLLTGWPDRVPVPPYAAYTDPLSASYVVIAIMVALEYRRETGKGQRIDHSQVTSGIDFIAPAILEYTVNGKVMGRQGNRDPYAAPHGAYPCCGNDRWCAIAVATDTEWENFCKVIGNPEWGKDARFSTLLGRKENEDELDRLVGEWTISHSPEEVTNLMQANGVPAGIVEKAEDLHRDPQFKHRHHFSIVTHPIIGPHAYDNFGVRLSRTPAQLQMPGPCIGEHNEFVCTKILGMSDEDFSQLFQEGVFE